MKRKHVIVAVAVLALVAGVFGPAAFAAKTNGTASGKQLLDPFTLQVLVLDDTGNGGNALKVSVADLTRQSIRIPQRPPMRSAFRPVY